MVFSKFCGNQTCYSRQKLLHCKCLQGFMGFPCNILVNIIGKNNNLYRENLQLLCVKFINVIGEPCNLFRENLLTQQENTIVGNFNNPCSFFPNKGYCSFSTTPNPCIERIHLLQNSTSSKFGKNPPIFTQCKFIQLVQLLLYTAANV